MITTQKTAVQKKLIATSYRLSNLGNVGAKKIIKVVSMKGSYVCISTLAEANILNF